MCGSGTKANKTPAGQLNVDGTYHCHSCNFHGDIFDLFGQVKGITNDAEKFKGVYEMFNINIDENQTPPTEKQPPEVNYTNYFRECHEKAGETDYFSIRGLSKTTINDFMLGYDPYFVHPKKPRAIPTSRIIIPTSKISFVARAVEPNIEPKIEKAGSSSLFNKKALTGTEPVFVTEGEIDALSVIEAGGQAMALWSVGNKQKLIQLCETEPPSVPLILCLDNDEAGQKTQYEIAEALKSLKIAYFEANISGGYKDPNEHLTSDLEAFRGIISDNIQAVITESETAKEKYINEKSVTAKINDFFMEIKSNADTPAVPTNFTELDNILDDGLYEGLYILGAISSLGKTSFALQTADQIAQQGQDVIIFSLEMAETELMAKSISRITFTECGGKTDRAKTTRGILSGKRHAGYSTEEKDLIGDAVKKYASYTDHLFIYMGGGDIGTSQIREITETHIKVTGNRPIVIIDYLQILAPYEPRATDKQNTDKAVFDLKRLSRDFKIPVLGVSSLNRENYNSAISMTAFKESGAIEYSSDVLIGMQFEAVGDILGADNAKVTSESINSLKRKDIRKIELKILKNRNGATGDSLTFDYYPKFNYFHETGKKAIKDDKNDWNLHVNPSEPVKGKSNGKHR